VVPSHHLSLQQYQPLQVGLTAISSVISAQPTQTGAARHYRSHAMKKTTVIDRVAFDTDAILTVITSDYNYLDQLLKAAIRI